MEASEIPYEQLYNSMIIKDEWKDKVNAQAQRVISKSGNYVISKDKINPAMPLIYSVYEYDLMTEAGKEYAFERDIY